MDCFRFALRAVVAGALLAMGVFAAPAYAVTVGVLPEESAAALAAAGEIPGDRLAQPSVSVSPSTDVDPAGQMVTVRGVGYQAGQGLYIQFCAQPTGTLGTTAGRAGTCNPDQTNDQSVWKTPVATTGDFSVSLRVVPSFAGTNCLEVTCGVFTRKDHVGGATDFSQDAFTALSFRAAAAPTSGSPPAPAPSTGPSADNTATPVVANTGVAAASPLSAPVTPTAAPSSALASARPSASPILAATGTATTGLTVLAVALIGSGAALLLARDRSVRRLREGPR